MMPKLNCSHEPKRASGRHRLFALAVLLALAPSLRAADVPALKDVLTDHFKMGVALNQRQFSGQDTNDAALAKENYNSIVAENEMKWERTIGDDCIAKAFECAHEADPNAEFDGAGRPKPAFEAVINTVNAADAPQTTHTNGELPK